MHDDEYINTLCNTGDGVYIVDENRHIVGWNKAAEDILKYKKSEVLNRDCYRVISGKTPDDAMHCRPDCRIHGAIESAPLKNFDLRTQTKDGEPIWLNISVFSPVGSGKKLVAHVLRDISREKRNELALLRLFEDVSAGEQEQNAVLPDIPAFPACAASGSTRKKSSEILSQREVEVLKLLAEGHPTKDLAGKLNISHYTARNHIQNILVKLGLHSKTQAVSYAYKKGIL